MTTKLINLTINYHNRQSNTSEKCTNLNQNQINKISVSELNYDEFFWHYMHQNKPVVITSVSNDWPCRHQWITSDSHVNYEFLRNKIYNMPVPVANCSQTYFNSHKKCEMSFYNYLDYWEKNSTNFQYHQKSQESLHHKQQQSDDLNFVEFEDENRNENILYLKDWHLKAKMPNYEFYEVPIYFASDWLNEFLVDKKDDDYRFVYMGPKGSWTPFHADVFSSFSWSTNIFGIKKWILLPPKEELKLKNNLGNLPFSINEKLLMQNHIEYFIINQYENEAIFVPSGWFHQVWNLTDTISINHNWFNSCNLTKIWFSLIDCMYKVVNEIQDCSQMDNFHEHGQIMLKAIFGINIQQFFDIIEYILKKRINEIINYNDYNNQTNHTSQLLIYTKFKFNKDHLLFDIKSIENIIEILKQNQFIQNHQKFVLKCNHLVETLHDFFKLYPI